MNGKIRSWYSGLTKAGKIALWAVTTIIVGGIISASASSPDNNSVDIGDTVEPVIETTRVTDTEPIPYKKTTVNDSSLEKGKKTVRTAGLEGLKTLTYEVTYTDGIETARKLIKEEVTSKPTNEVVAIGTYVKPKPTPSHCDPNYSGDCVPISSDVDCAGGSGNGPTYVSGPVYVTGSDIYGLDGDGDGVGCE